MPWVPDWSTGDDLYEKVEDEVEAADLEYTEQGFDPGFGPQTPPAWEAEVDRFLDAANAEAEDSDAMGYEDSDEDGDEA